MLRVLHCRVVLHLLLLLHRCHRAFSLAGRLPVLLGAAAAGSGGGVVIVVRRPGLQHQREAGPEKSTLGVAQTRLRARPALLGVRGVGQDERAAVGAAAVVVGGVPLRSDLQSRSGKAAGSGSARQARAHRLSCIPGYS